mmetsp:Transcript_2420/g.4454  ORF Transcript_2420/g.4454 Transcript_2420/m.4454 type:complete len:264 (+) Transcript_2420:205-996(+)
MDSVWTIGKAHVSHVDVLVTEPGVLAKSMCAVNLHGLVNNLQANSWRLHLDHRNVGSCSLPAPIISYRCCQIAELPGSRDLHAEFCNPFQDLLLLNELLSEGFTALSSINQGLQSGLCLPDCPHAVMKPAGSKTSLCNGKAIALSNQQVCLRHPHILENNLGMVMLVSKERQRPQNVDTWRVPRDKDHRKLCVLWPTGGCPPQEHKYFALGSDGPGDVPLVTVDHIVIPLSNDPCADVRGVGGCNARLRHGKSRPYFPLQKRL